MTTAALNLRIRTASQNIKNKISIASSIKVHWKKFYFLLIAFSFLMMIFYIFMVNELTRGAYAIKDYNKDITNLIKENKQLQADSAHSNFLGKVREKAKELSFEKTTNVRYIQILQNSLAQSQKTTK